MADLEKLNNAINELEKQSSELKDFNTAYAEITKLKEEIFENLNLLKGNNRRLDEVSAEVKKQLDESEKKIRELHEDNKTFQKELESSLSSWHDEVGNRINELFKDNKTFQKELDSSITSRLDRHKSDIQVEIRDEGKQIQRVFETTLNSNFHQLDNKMKEKFDGQTVQIRTLRILLIILLVISIGIGISIFLKP